MQKLLLKFIILASIISITACAVTGEEKDLLNSETNPLQSKINNQSDDISQILKECDRLKEFGLLRLTWITEAVGYDLSLQGHNMSVLVMRPTKNLLKFQILEISKPQPESILFETEIDISESGPQQFEIPKDLNLEPRTPYAWKAFIESNNCPTWAKDGFLKR